MEQRFIVDLNVGRLAKWLRIMGYDTLFPEESGDNALVRTALREGRVLVTRDSGIARRRPARLGQVRVVHIKDDDLKGQLRQLVLELKLDLIGEFSRCLCCNRPLEPKAKGDVAPRLPPYVLRTHSEFMATLRPADPFRVYGVPRVPAGILARHALVEYESRA